MKSKNKQRCTGLKPALLVMVAVAVAGSGTKLVLASHLNGQIDDLSQQNSQSQEAQAALEVEATSLQDKINRLRAEINGLESQIQENQAKNNEIQKQIEVTEAELEKQKDLLGQNIKQMYLEGDISTLEMLASSKDLSEFVDKEQYRSSVQDKIKTTLDKITALKLELKSKKETIDKLIADQKAMQGKLDTQRAEQNRLLGLNQSQQAAYEQNIKNNSAKIEDLRRQQAAENTRLFGGNVPTGIPGGGGYPGKWAFAPIDSMLDSWGMYNRECVSYTAWKVWSTGRYMPYWGGVGNAKQWDDNARAAGIPVDGNPRRGDVAISNSGTYGHSMYVEQVGSGGSIYVSDYNQQFDGNYREYWINGDTVRERGLVFIHF